MAHTLSPPKTRLVITVSGGVVTSVCSNLGSGDCCGVGGGGDDCAGSTALSATACDGGEHSGEDDGFVCGAVGESWSLAGMD